MAVGHNNLFLRLLVYRVIDKDWSSKRFNILIIIVEAILEVFQLLRKLVDIDYNG